MRSTNPVLTRADSFTGRQRYQAAQFNQGYGQASYGQAPYGQAPMGQSPYGQPVTPSGVMTLDDVVTKSGIVMAVMMLVAGLTWMMLPPILYLPAMVVSGLVGFVVVLFATMRRLVSPSLVVAYAALEGVFIGVFSRVFENFYPGIVAQAVIGTFAAAGVTLAAYKFFNIRVTGTFRKVVTFGTIGLAVALLVNFVLYLFGVDTGMRSGVTGPVGGFSILISALAVGLAVLNLVLDFDYIEQGIANRAPASESWRAALGLVVTMVWLYTEIIRILSYLRR